MNKTFKVVFNRARAGLMVANEITSSVQKKGTKTVVAVAALGLMTMFAQANTPEYADAIWDAPKPRQVVTRVILEKEIRKRTGLPHSAQRKVHLATCQI